MTKVVIPLTYNSDFKITKNRMAALGEVPRRFQIKNLKLVEMELTLCELFHAVGVDKGAILNSHILLIVFPLE